MAQGIVGAPDKAFIITSSEIENFNELEKNISKDFILVLIDTIQKKVVNVFFILIAII